MDSLARLRNKPMTLDCVTLENGSISLQVARSFGPRIVSLNYVGGTNLLAELPDVVSVRPDGKIYHFYGGHRLWLAPEDPIRSYACDDLAVEISETNLSLLVRKPVEEETGIEKSLYITLVSDEAKLTINHCLTNLGLSPLECAPWAITQLRMGGVAIMPQMRTQTELLPNRLLVLWPYADISSPHVHWGNQYVLLRAEEQPPFKIGFHNPRGWLGYWLDGILFIKRAAYSPGAVYVDFGSSSECYCDHRFIELETLAPIVAIAPGGSVSHTETWELYENVDVPEDEDAIQAIVDGIGLE